MTIAAANGTTSPGRRIATRAPLRVHEEYRDAKQWLKAVGLLASRRPQPLLQLFRQAALLFDQIVVLGQERQIPQKHPAIDPTGGSPCGLPLKPPRRPGR